MAILEEPELLLVGYCFMGLAPCHPRPGPRPVTRTDDARVGSPAKSKGLVWFTWLSASERTSRRTRRHGVFREVSCSDAELGE